MVWQNIVGTFLLIMGFIFWNINPLIALVCLISSISFVAVGMNKSKEKDQHKQNRQLESVNTKPIDTNLNHVKNTYVINPKTMVFHRKSCPYAQKTMSFNKHYTDSRSAAISIGYKPCTRCKP